MIGLILDHFWQSTLFAVMAGLFALFLKDNSAKVRYGIWLSASLKFLFPLALLTAGGTALSALLPSQLPATQVVAALDVATPVMAALDGATQPFSVDTSRIVQTALAPAPSWDWGLTLALIWFVGFAWLVTLWLRRWLTLRAIVRSAVPFAISAPLPVKFSSSLLEPGLVGIFRPVLLLPNGITDQLSASELDTVIAHEVCHWRRRDNLTAVLHMLVEALFWFYPLVWWLEIRLISERERACDEAVVATGRDPELYAESILKVCKFFVQSPLPCVAGVSGADLKKRLENIVRNKAALRLNFSRKALLTIIAAIIIVAPLLAGLADSRQALAALTPAHPIASSNQVADNPMARPAPQTNEPATAGADTAPDQGSRNGATRSETASAPPNHPTENDATGRADFSQLGPQLAAAMESQVTTELPQIGNLWPVRLIAPRYARPDPSAAPVNQYPAPVLKMNASPGFDGWNNADAMKYCRDFAVQTVSQGANVPLIVDDSVKQRLTFFYWHCAFANINGTYAHSGGGMSPGYVALGQASPDHPVNVTGHWSISIPLYAQADMAGLKAMQTEPQSCNFTQVGNTISGTCTGRNDTGAVTGVIDGRQVRWVWKFPQDDRRHQAELDFLGMVGPDGAVTGQSINLQFGHLGAFVATPGPAQVASQD